VDKSLPGRKPMVFEKLETATGASYFFIYLYNDADRNMQVGVVYEVAGDQYKNPDVTAAIDASLRSLAVGPDAVRVRRGIAPPPTTKRRR
jgi:hypothetical protein